MNPQNVGHRTPRLYPLPAGHQFTNRSLMSATRMNGAFAHAALRGELLLTLVEADRLAVYLHTHLDALWPELAEATPHICEQCDEPVRASSRYCSLSHQNRAYYRRHHPQPSQENVA